ncbi:hypothetical protein GCM10009665_33310 [Kitasatospora nipponensis]|uniref:Uncharacterized protein n=1 Tax=Kitasatospora nipponensis TaxID=258049 RepID=A0ABN1WEN4_9ACTN
MSPDRNQCLPMVHGQAGVTEPNMPARIARGAGKAVDIRVLLKGGLLVAIAGISSLLWHSAASGLGTASVMWAAGRIANRSYIYLERRM